MKPHLYSVKKVAVLTIVAMCLIASLPLIPKVFAVSAIYLLNPASGIVGASIVLTGNLTTVNGTFEVFFDNQLIANGTALDATVNATLIIPSTYGGNHTVLLKDLTTGDNATKPFDVLTAYALNVTEPESPAQYQEGDSVPIYLNVTGGPASGAFHANVTVKDPSGAVYTSFTQLNSSDVGTAEENLVFPQDFGTEATSRLAGTYEATFNETLSQDNFVAGLTNATEYHRTQTVDIKAVYRANENVTISVTGANVSFVQNTTADAQGLLHFDGFSMPLNASIGDYAVSVSSISSVNPTVKTPSDTQVFSVNGYAINITAKNLAGEGVQSVTVKAYENGTLVKSLISDADGLVLMFLEYGNYSSTGEYKNVAVGELTVDVVGNMSVDLTCSLTNLNIQVATMINDTLLGVPQTSVFLGPDNNTFTTNITGFAVAHSLLPNVTYTLNASRYEHPFGFVTTLEGLLVDGTAPAWFNETIICPTLALQITVLKADGEPAPDLQVVAQDLDGGIFYQQSTDSTGQVAFNSAFGRYSVRVLTNQVQLNATTADLFSNQTMNIVLNLLELSITVKVVDYFGQPISNANVTLQREGQETRSGRTGSQGTVVFTNMIGGISQITVYLSGQTQPISAENLVISNSSTVMMTVGRYVLFAGFLVETSLLVVSILIIVIAVLIAITEIIRRRRKKAEFQR